MTPRRAPVSASHPDQAYRPCMRHLDASAAKLPTLPADATVGLAASPPTRSNQARRPSSLRAILATLLLVPIIAIAQPAAQVPASDTTAGRAPAPVTAPAPAASAPLGQAPRVAMPSSSTSSPGAGGLLQTIMALTLVLALLAGLAWLLKRYGPRPGGGTANLRVVGALNLGGRERIMVVEVGDQWIVVGAAPGRVNALHTMPRQEGELTAGAAHGGIPATSFSDWLKNTIDKRNAT